MSARDDAGLLVVVPESVRKTRLYSVLIGSAQTNRNLALSLANGFRLNVFFDKMFFNKIQISSCLNKKNLLAIVIGVSSAIT